MPIATPWQLRRDIEGRRWWPILGCALILSSSALAGGQAGVVRNGTPQTPADPTRHEDPLYCPRSAVAAAIAVEGETPEALLVELAELHSTLQLEEALRIAERLVQVAPDRPLSHYNLACVLAKLHRIEPALDALDAAVDAGWRRVAQTVVDLDLDPVREQPRFAAIIARMRRLEERERLRPVPLREDPWTLVADDLAREAPRIIQRHHVPGVTISLIHDGRLVWTGAAGVSHQVRGTSMGPDARFRGYGPAHLLALTALVREDGAGLIPADRIVQLARESDPPGGRARAAADRPTSLQLVRGAEPARAEPSAAPAGDSFVHRALVDALPLAIEVSTGTSYARYCQGSVLRPIGAVSTFVVDRRSIDADTVFGHTPMGTPVRPATGGDGSVSTTAGDAARLVARLLAAENGPRPASLVLRRVAAADHPYGAAPRPVTVSEGPAGPRIELAGEDLGCGWLIRWHPARECGVVVLYNAEGGSPAARRLAQIALGGV